MFISKTCYDKILNHYRNCGPCSRVWQTRIIDLSSYLPYRCFIDETKPDESIDVRKNLSIFFFFAECLTRVKILQYAWAVDVQ